MRHGDTLAARRIDGLTTGAKTTGAKVLIITNEKTGFKVLRLVWRPVRLRSTRPLCRLLGRNFGGDNLLLYLQVFCESLASKPFWENKTIKCFILVFLVHSKVGV